MSLSKQLFIFVSVLFLIIFSLNFLISVKNIKSYLETEAQGHAQDTATSLGLSLSPYIAKETDPVMQTMINAIFDMGYYREIKLVNVENKPLVVVNNNEIFADVPKWFVEMLPMQVATASSEINSGWNISGTVYVTINPGYAYLKLFEQAKSALIYSFIIFVFTLLLLSLVLRFILLPLQAINQLALTIADGKFTTIEKLPWTKEVRNVAISMNTMSNKLEGVIRNFNTKLEGLGKKLQLDDVTGLQKKSTFETDIKQLFLGEIEAYIFIIKLDVLASLAKEQGADSIDAFLRRFAALLRASAAAYPEESISFYRFFGSEFALIARLSKREEAEELAKSLSNMLADLAKEYQRTDIAHIGVAPLNPLGTVASNLAAAVEAFEQALLIGVNSYYIRVSDDRAKDITAWKELVFRIVDNQEYEVSYQGKVMSLDTEEILMEDALTSAYDNGVKIIPIGTFVSIAEKYSKIVDLDQGITQKVMIYIKSNMLKHQVAISLSTRTVKNPGFRSWLIDNLKNQAVAKQLVFCVSVYAVAKEIEVYKEFFAFVHSLGAKVMLKRFDPQSLSLEVAKYLKPDYIRLTRELSNEIEHDPGKRVFVETLQEAAKLLDIVMLAENVRHDNDYTLLKNLGFKGASR